MTVYDEPLLRQTSDRQTVLNLLAAGYSVAADHGCQQQEISAHAVWTHTHSSLAFNPYQVINADGSSSVDEPYTASLMAYCRATLGVRCTMGNDSIRTPIDKLGPNYGPMYASLSGSGPNLYFQTAKPSKVGDLAATITWAIGQGASDVELPKGYASMLPASILASDNQALSLVAR